MKFVFASDSFKGSLSSARIGELLEAAARETFPDAECITFPIADGGEGTLDAIASVKVGETVALPAHDGLMRPMEGAVFLCGKSAFVEAASTCGLTLIRESERDPLTTSSYGVGECIRFALDQGCESVSIGLGGSCTNDGGMGCLRALGVSFYDASGHELDGAGADLERVVRIDESGLDPRVRGVSVTVMNDVSNPLLGPSGATYVFGPQKGADDAGLERLEAGMRNYAEVVASAHPEANFETAGFGAAGGLGMALAVFLGARMRSGIEELLGWFDFDAAIDGADVVVTGEGKLDSQSLDGKAISGVVGHAKRLGVPVAVICGKSDLDAQELDGLGLACMLETGKGQPLDYAMQHAEESYLQTARGFFASLRDGRGGAAGSGRDGKRVVASGRKNAAGDDGCKGDAGKGEGKEEKERSKARRANGFVAGLLVLFFFCAHGLLGSLSLAFPLINHFAWVVWAGTALIVVHVVLSAFTTREKLTKADKPPTAKKKLKIALRWATGILIAITACAHIGSVMLFGGSAVESTQVGKIAVLAVIALLALHVCLGVKSLVRDLGASKEQKDSLKTPLRLVICLIAAAFFVIVLVCAP